MTLKHIKCTIFFVIGCLSLLSLISCTSNKNKAANIELSAGPETIISDENPQNQYQNVLNIDDGALAELELWTAFFVLQKEVLKLEKNKPNAFEESERNLKIYFKDLNLNIPEVFDTNSIWVRIKVLETNAYQFYEASTNHPEGSRRIKETKNNVMKVGG